MMKAKEIQDLIEFISSCGMDEVNIETDQIKLHVKKHGETRVIEAAPAMMAPAPQPVAAQVAAVALSPSTTESARVEAKKAEENANYIGVKAPMIGTFYRTPNPDSPPFVNVGDRIEKGQTICIIEAMKLFNEIESDVSGTVVKVVAENSSPVEYDQVLFLIDPS